MSVVSLVYKKTDSVRRFEPNFGRLRLNKLNIQRINDRYLSYGGRFCISYQEYELCKYQEYY